MSEITRRNFLFGAGAAGAALAVSAIPGTAFAAGSGSASGSASASASASGSASASSSVSASAAASASASASATASSESDIMTVVDTMADADWASQVTEEISCDVLVVGGGFSGTCAAVQAGENGSSVILAEGRFALGGNGLGVECTNAYGLHPNSADVTLGEMVAYESKAQAYTTNQMFVRDMVSHAAENVQWLIDNGVQYEKTEDLGQEYLDMYKAGRYRAEYSFEYVYSGGAAGAGFFPAMKAKLNEYGVNLRLGTRVRSLILGEDGNVIGAYATDDYGDVVKIDAKAIIIGTGGNGEDDKHWAKLGLDINDIRVIGTAGHYGDGVNMIIQAGGIDHGAPAYGCTNIIGSANAWGPIWDKLCWGGPSLWVDIHGERFSDEAVSTYTHNFELQNLPVRLVGGTCWSVMDSDILTNMLDGDQDASDLWNQMIQDGDDAYQADTLDELADIMGVDKELFLAQVDTYNASVAQGVDVDYGKDPQYLMPIQTAPFYCGLIRGALEGLYSGGVKTDRSFRVKKPGRDQAFDNLFAVGADGGMLYNFVYGLDINGSMSCHGLNSARTAANTAKAYIDANATGNTSASATSSASSTAENPMTIVKTVANQLTLVSLDLTAADSPVTISSDDPTYADFFSSLEALTGFDIQSMSLTVSITESEGAAIGATGEIPIVQDYTLESLTGVVDGQDISYTK